MDKFDKTQLLMLVFAVAVAVVVAWMPGDPVNKLKLTIGYAVLVLVLMFGLAVIAAIIRGQIDLSELISELDGGASMSRFQLLIFTFVIALSFLYLTISARTFPDVPAQVLTLLGLSASTYAVSKGIQVSSGQVGQPGGEPGKDDEEHAKGAKAGKS
jgi:hypothetical protein